MGLEQTIRNAVAAAATAVADLLVDVEHEPFAGKDADGKASYGRAVTRQAFVMSKDSTLFRLIGVERVNGESALFIGNVPVTTDDRITLPGGKTPKISAVDGVADPGGGTYYTWVKFERPGRGTLTS